MTVKLVMLKSGEDIIADVKEIKSDEQDVVGYFFHDPLIVKMYSPEEPVVLSEENGVEGEHGTTKEISSISDTTISWLDNNRTFITFVSSIDFLLIKFF